MIKIICEFEKKVLLLAHVTWRLPIYKVKVVLKVTLMNCTSMLPFFLNDKATVIGMSDIQN